MAVDDTTTANGTGTSTTTDSRKLLWDDKAFARRYRETEAFMGEHALDMLRQMGVSAATETPVNFLDLACGTGVVLKHAISLLDLASGDPPSSSQTAAKYRFTAVDLAPAMLDALRSRVESEAWLVKPVVERCDMRDTKLPADSFTHVTCNFGPCSAPNPLATLRESYRVLVQGGVAGWTAWMATGWYPDFAAALDEIRSSAANACKHGKGNLDDERLAKIPNMLSFESMVAMFVGIDDLSVAKDEDGTTPRWENEDYFVKQVRKAGFVDVQVSIVSKTLEMSSEDAYEMVKPLLTILRNSWSEEEKKVLEGGLLERTVQEQFKRKIEGSGAKKIVWDNWKAMVVTARKST